MEKERSWESNHKIPYKKPENGEEIVISGMSGKFPNSHNIYHFRDNLFNKVDMVSADHRRWKTIFSEVPQRTGKLYDIENFDRGFFGITHTQSNYMDPVSRLLLERTYEAITDAGYNPEDFAGTNTAVISGACFSETEKIVYYESQEPFSDSILSIGRSMTAARICYYLKTVGPTFQTDTACSSSLFAVEDAYRKLVEGKCDKAIVVSTNLCLHPNVSLQFARLGVLSADGSCKSFDNGANGYVRSEGIVVIILEKAKDARRMYAEIVHSKTNCDGYKREGITFPSTEAQKVLMKEFYEETQVDPTSLTYVEAHGTGTPVGDPEELKSMDEVLCTGRNKPLLIGAVKSNIGHNEPASGLCSIVKTVIGMETGFIPPNINFEKPKEGVEALAKGRMIIVTEKTPVPDDDGGLFAINNFGFGGANAHVLLRRNTKVKVNQGIPADNLPRLICLSARTELGVTTFLDDVQSRPLDAEYLYLINQAFRKQLENNVYRGYGIFSKHGEMKRSVKIIDIETPKLYLVFSNAEKEFLKLGNRLNDFPIFANTIKNIQNILRDAENIDIYQVIKETVDENLMNQILGTVSIQISLANILKAIKLKPDQILGLGSGELVAAYVDNYLTLRQAVLALFCATASLNIKRDNTNLNVLKKILPNERNSYDKWMPGDEAVLRRDPATYFLNNIMGLTNRRNIKRVIPSNALTLIIGADIGEMSEKTLLLMDVNSTDPLVNFLSNLGSLYEFGFEMELNMLYPRIELPVSRGTPMLSPLVKWQDMKCDVHLSKNEAEVKSGYRVINIASKSEEWTFVVGHVVDGRNLFPATGYLTLVWDSLSRLSGKSPHKMKIFFKDVKYIRAANVPKEGSLELTVTVQIGTHSFEIAEGGLAIVTGKIYEITDEQSFVNIPVNDFPKSTDSMDENDIYKELKLRGYQYTGLFRGVRKCSVDASQGIVHWDSNWTAFMDCLLQLLTLQTDTRNIYVPTSIGQLLIDAPKHLEACRKYDDNIPVELHKNLNVIRTEGIEVRGIGASVINRKQCADPILEVSKFIPNVDRRDALESVRIITQLVLENTGAMRIKVVEVCSGKLEENKLLCPMIQKALDDMPAIQQDLIVLSNKIIELPKISVQNKPLRAESNCLVLVVTKLLETIQTSVAVDAVNGAKGYIISREDLETDLSKFNDGPFSLICSHTNDNEMLVLLRPTSRKLTSNVAYVNLTNAFDDYQWVTKLQEEIKNRERVVLYSQNEDTSGLLGLTTCLLREISDRKIKCFLIMDEAPTFSPTLEFYKKQLDKDLATNIWKDGTWGTYRHLALPKSQTVESEHTFVNVTTIGDLSTLTWLEGNLKQDEHNPEYDKELIHVHSSALNFRDLMTASGKITPDVITPDRIQQECCQGFEFAGRNTKGERVMGMCGNGALASIVLCDKRMIYKIPEEWTMEDAATTVVVYTTVLQVLRDSVLEPGKTILIHSGTGGIGLAAINLALHYGLTVFVTVGTQEKRDYLRKHYPQIKEEHIGNSRDTSFEMMVHQYTNGRGVDYVLNSLAEEKLLASVRCLAKGGQFFEIGKFDLVSNNPLAMSLLEKDAHFSGIALDRIFERYYFPMHVTKKLFYDLIKKGAIKPLPRTIFKKDEVEQAFRFMGSGKHIGKVVINVREEEDGAICSVPRTLFKAAPRMYCHPSYSYLICGGLGGFGMELADLLVVRGAKNLILTSKSGLCKGYQKYRIRIWKSYGVKVLTTTLDASTEEGCTELLSAANEMGPVHSIFNLAAVLSDEFFEKQTEETFKISAIPKASCTKNLDCISRKLCPNLRYFVVFSSLSCGRGNAGQTNYGMANSVMERICEKRKREGYPALAIQWGAIGEVGLVANMQADNKELVIGGTLQQRISNCLQVMDKFMQQDEPIVGSMVVAEKRHGGSADNLFDAVLSIMGISNLKSVSMHSTFPELGMDSMAAVEIKQTLEREYEVSITPQDIRGMTLAKLKDLSDNQETAVFMENSLVQTEMPDAIKLLLRHIGTVQMSKAPLIKMKTSVGSGADAPHVFVFPGIEGMATVLEPLCESLKAHVSCLQFCPGVKVESITQLASSVLPYVETSTEDVIIIAYSYGCAVAVELMHMLEARGKQAKLIFVDGSLEVIVRLVKIYFPNDDENSFQTDLLCTLMMHYMSLDHVLNQKEHLLKLSTYQERIDYVLEDVPFSLDISKSYITEMCIATYEKLSALHKYKFRDGKLKSPLILFKAVSNLLVNSSADYDLSNTFENIQDVVAIEGNHVTILENEQLSREINRILGML